MKPLISLIVASLMVISAIAADSPTKPLFQMRLVSETPTSDTEPMTLITKNKDHAFTNILNLQKTVLLDQTDLKSAKSVKDRLGQPVIELNFTDAGAKQFATVTRSNLHKQVAILIDGKICQAPIIQSEISRGQAQISGNFSESENKDFVKRINDTLKEK